MAQSLTPWMVGSISQGLSSTGGGLLNEQKDEHDIQGESDNDEDTPFQKGSKVQIIRFLGFSGVPSQEKSGSLWALVSDRTHWVCVEFTKQCVADFDKVHSRNLISMRGSIIALRWFRPRACLKAAQLYALETDFQGTGPFSKKRLRPRLYFQVEAIHLWGSINEAIFWDTDDLDYQIEEGTSSLNAKDRVLIMRWLAETKRKHLRKLKQRTLKEGRNSAFLANASNQTSSMSESGPAPYQQPKQRFVVSKQTPENNSSQAAWGDFSLSWADDNYGLQSAGEDLLAHSEPERDLSDPFAFMSPSLTSDEPALKRDSDEAKRGKNSTSGTGTTVSTHVGEEKRKRKSDDQQSSLEQAEQAVKRSKDVEQTKKMTNDSDDNSWLNLLSVEE